MKIVSYNINSGKGPDDICVPENSMNVLKKEHADVIALQEVAAFRPGCPQVDYLKEAEKFLNMYAEFGKTLNFDNGGSFGNGILSKYPIEKIETFLLDFPEVVCQVIPELSPCVGFDQKNFHHCFDIYTNWSIIIKLNNARMII